MFSTKKDCSFLPFYQIKRYQKLRMKVLKIKTVPQNKALKSRMFFSSNKKHFVMVRLG